MLLVLWSNKYLIAKAFAHRQGAGVLQVAEKKKNPSLLDFVGDEGMGDNRCLLKSVEA